MELTNEIIQQKLTEAFGDAVSEWAQPYGLLTLRVAPERNIDLLRFIADDKQLGFTFMTDLTAVHYPDRANEELCVVYHMHNMAANVRLRIKAYIPVAQPEIASATCIYSTANWLEREAYDFFGVQFTGHPNLIRIMNVDEMDYFPLRKEYEMEDPTRRDKDDEMFGRGSIM